MPKHVGIYAGTNLVVECTTAGKSGVIITSLSEAKKLHGSAWIKHGKLPFVKYINQYASCCEYKRENGICPGCENKFKG